MPEPTTDQRSTTNTAPAIEMVANLEPDGCAYAYGWHDPDAFLRAWDLADEGDGLGGEPITDAWREVVMHWYACEVEDFDGDGPGVPWAPEPYDVDDHHGKATEWRKATVLPT